MMYITTVASFFINIICEQKEATVVCEDQEVEEYYKFYIIHE